MLKIAVAGYGNVGKAVEKLCKSDKEIQLVAVFSRRKLPEKRTVPFENAKLFCGKIDVVIMTMGSTADITTSATAFAKYFNTVDSFDRHEQFDFYRKTLTECDEKHLHLIGAGWDPGVLSIARVLGQMCCDNAQTFWGKGVSQGHSNALRSIQNVTDAVEFTVPEKRAVRLAKRGKTVTDSHKRLCFVVCERRFRKTVTAKIHAMAEFGDYPTQVRFVGEKRLAKLKKRTSHKGLVVSRGHGNAFETGIFAESNAELTARILICYAKAVAKMAQNGETGAMTIFDVPIKYIAGGLKP